MQDHADEELAVAVVQGPLRLEDLLYQAGKSGRIAPLQLLRPDRIVSEDQLRTAAWHARRAFAEGRNHADRIEVEFTRYVACERQIRKALDRVGIDDEAPTAILCALGAKRLDALQHFMHALGLEEAETSIGAGEAALEHYGIGPDAIAATTDGLALDLILERVAAVDAMRK